MIKKKSKSIALLTAALLWAGLSQAQESFNTSGRNITGSGGSFAYSVGQVVYTTNIGSTGKVAQGVQHTYEIFTLVHEEPALRISLTVFPNPTTENVTLQVSDYNNEKLTYQLFDMQGRQLSNAQITAQRTRINMSSLPPAVYFIHVANQDQKKFNHLKS